MAKYRSKRVSELLLGFLAEEIRRMSTEAGPLVSVTGVDVSRDLRFAKVYWSLLQTLSSDSQNSFPGEAEIQEAEDALKEVKPFLRKRIAEELNLRYVPELLFRYDTSLATGARIDQLLDKLTN